jgi:predicted PurR-regulated permease PerM
MDAHRSETLFFVSLLVIAIFLSGLILLPYLSVFVLAGTLGLLFRPLYQGLLRVLRHESIAALTSVVIVAFIVFLPLWFFGQRIFTEATTLYISLTSHGGFDFVTALGNFLHIYFKNLPTSDIVLDLNQYAQQALSWLVQNMGQLFSRIAQVFFLSFLTLFGLFYFFKDGARMKKWLLQTVPLAPEYTEEILDEISVIGGSIIRGTLITAIILGITMGIGFFLFNIPNPIFWAAAITFASVIPIVGPWLILVPAIAYLFFTGQSILAICLALWSIIFVNVLYSVLSPQLMRRGVDIHPYVILLSILGGIGLFGPIGFLLGPLVITFLFSLLKIYKKLITVSEQSVS